MTFAQGTDDLILDEPLASLDMGHARGLMRRLRTLARAHGRTGAVVLHEVNYAAAHADHVVGLRAGRVVLDGSPAQVLTGEGLAALFDASVEVHEVDGRPVVLHNA